MAGMSKGITVEIFASWWGVLSTSQVFATFPYRKIPSSPTSQAAVKAALQEALSSMGWNPKKPKMLDLRIRKKGRHVTAAAAMEMVEISGATFLRSVDLTCQVHKQIMELQRNSAMKRCFVSLLLVNLDYWLFVTSHLHLCQYQLSSLFFWGADVQTKVRMTCWTLRVSSWTNLPCSTRVWAQNQCRGGYCSQVERIKKILDSGDCGKVICGPKTHSAMKSSRIQKLWKEFSPWEVETWFYRLPAFR